MAEKQPEAKQAGDASLPDRSEYDRIAARPIFDKLTKEEMEILSDVDEFGLTAGERDTFYLYTEGSRVSTYHVWEPTETPGLFPEGYNSVFSCDAASIDNAIAVARESIQLNPDFVITDSDGNGYRFINLQGDSEHFYRVRPADLEPHPMLPGKSLFDKLTAEEIEILRDVDDSGFTDAVRSRHILGEFGITVAKFHVWEPGESPGQFPVGYNHLLEFEAGGILNAVDIARESLHLEQSFIFTDGYSTGYRFINSVGDVQPFSLAPVSSAELTDGGMPSWLKPVPANQPPSPGDLAEGKGVEQQKAGRPRQPRLSNGIRL
ncbi:hypothetical protein [Paludisphaera borealis]|uniref:hypothetical protein n=1 Tax=Paludisphaera borealis TaxID=1387353 RepID=UPI0009714BE0|nr:hypothetical protein [Paludisphaera borealis]